MTTKNLASSIAVSSPCSEDWDKMQGNEKVRFCSHCALSVNNISAMSQKEAIRLVRKSDGRICIRYIKHPKTKAPVFTDKLYQISRRAGLAAGVLGASLAVSSVAYAQGGITFTKNSEVKTETDQSRKTANTKQESPAASVSGTITDPNGAIIPGAIISISSTNFSRTLSTNQNGDFLFTNVPAEELTMKIESSGFEDKEITVNAYNGRETVANSTLEIGEIFAVGGMMVSISYYQPLHQAVADGELEAVTTLLVNGEDVNSTDKNYQGITALFVAVENGNVEIVETLLNFGAKIDVRDNSNRTPLMALDYNTSPDLIRLLLKHGADISAVDDSGNTVLHAAAENDNSEIIEILINEGADINAQNEEGQTPLMVAAYYEVFETVKALLNSGAKVNIRDNENETALTIAKGEEGEEAEKIVELLMQYGARE